MRVSLKRVVFNFSLRDDYLLYNVSKIKIIAILFAEGINRRVKSTKESSPISRKEKHTIHNTLHIK